MSSAPPGQEREGGPGFMGSLRPRGVGWGSAVGRWFGSVGVGGGEMGRGGFGEFGGAGGDARATWDDPAYWPVPVGTAVISNGTSFCDVFVRTWMTIAGSSVVSRLS